MENYNNKKENNGFFYYQIIFYLDNKRHRIDGPADISKHKGCCDYIYNHYCLYDTYYTERHFAEKTNHLICLNCNKFCKQECFA